MIRTETAQQVVAFDLSSLPSMVKRSAAQLASATNAAEILEARENIDRNYDEHKRQSRILKAKGAHSEFIAKVHRGQADCLELAAEADRRLADEYDAAQERGEVAKVGQPSIVPNGNNKPATADEILGEGGRKVVHDARLIRDAEAADPGIVRRTLDAKLNAGEEPTKAAVREAVIAAAQRGGRGSEQSNKNPLYRTPTVAGSAWTHLYGVCRALMEWATPDKIALALSGHAERDDNQAANLASVIKARDLLNQIIGDINAQ